MVPFHLVLAALFGWLEREQRDVIEFLHEENRVLKGQLRGLRMRLRYWGECGDRRRCRLGARRQRTQRGADRVSEGRERPAVRTTGRRRGPRCHTRLVQSVFYVGVPVMPWKI